MAVLKRVICKVDRYCVKCQDIIKAGTVAVKDRRKKKFTGRTLYSHSECYGRRR